MNKTTYIIETSNTYDAAGTKLRKVAYDNSGVLISRTEYIGGIQYESLQPLASPPLTTDLKFMSTGEGRVVKEGSNWNYEYYHKDHLGNTRVVYGYQKQVDEYKATMETQFAAKEQAQFYNIATRRATVFNHTTASIDVTAPDKSAETNGNTSKAIGPAKMLQVNAGDRVQLEVFARYQTGTGGNNALISNLASAVTGSFLLNAGEAAHTAITNNVPTQAATISQTSGVPKSYLFYILFNNSYAFQQFGYVLVNSTAQAGHQQMYLDITVPTGGYLYTYVANESNVSAGVSVYYDDFTIVHTRSTPTLQVLQTSDYYPFGLQIAAGSYQKQTTLDNDYLYNGKELQDEHNLGWMDYGARMYDPSCACFHTIDPASTNYYGLTPYHYVLNNPIKFIDPTGKFTELYNGNGKKIGEDSDGKDGRVSIITDNKEANRIREDSKDGKTATEKDVLSGVQTTKDALTEALNVLGRANSNGGLREEISVVTEGGNVVKGSTGPEPKIENINGMNIQTADSNIPKLPDGTDKSRATLIHSHPIQVQQDGNQLFPQMATKPSTHDQQFGFRNFGTNIIVGNLTSPISQEGGQTKIVNATQGAAIYTGTSLVPKATLSNSVIQKIIKK